MKNKKSKMKDNCDSCDFCNCNCGKSKNYGSGCLGAVYGLGFIGAAIFYIQQATGFWSGVLGVLKAIIWPAFLVHKLLGI